MAARVPFVGLQSPFLHGGYVVGDEPIWVSYRKIEKDYRPKQQHEDVVVGAVYCDRVNLFAGPCTKVKVKQNQQWAVVLNLKTGKERSINPRLVFFLIKFACIILVCFTSFNEISCIEFLLDLFTPFN